MITSLKTILLLSLFFTVAVGASLRGADTQAPSVPTEVNPDGSMARITSIDTAKRTLTLQAKGANHLFFVDPHLTNTRTHQQIALNQLANGQLISFVTRPQSNGVLEIVSLMILHKESTGPSGGGSHGGPMDVSPFK